MSLPGHDGMAFCVGQGVHWGYNGDSYPGTVLYVSDSGREVYVSKDEYKVVDGEGGYVEGARGCEFTTVNRELKDCTVWKLRKSGRFTEGPGKHVRSLHTNRQYSSNPCL